MPKDLERRLQRQVARKHPTWPEDRKKQYVYGALRKSGWRPKRRR